MCCLLADGYSKVLYGYVDMAKSALTISLCRILMPKEGVMPSPEKKQGNEEGIH
jgi:hypothetical protein